MFMLKSGTVKGGLTKRGDGNGLCQGWIEHVKQEGRRGMEKKENGEKVRRWATIFLNPSYITA
jgi:hypothetical protein